MKNRKVNFLKLGIFLFGTSLLLWNCENEEIEHIKTETKKELKLETVSLENAKNIFENYQKNKPTTFARGESDELTLDPQWETTTQDSINNTDALITNTETIINREGGYISKIFFIEVNDSINKGIYTEWSDEAFENGEIKNGRIYFNDFDGEFLDAYKITDGIITHRLVPSQQTQQASIFSFVFLFFQATIDTPPCWNTDTLGDFEGGQLDDVEITLSGGGGGPGEGGSTFTSAWSMFSGSSESGDSNNDSESNNNGGGTGNNNNEENCTGGKVLNTTTNQCECPEGKVEDSDGNCIDNPCTYNKPYNSETGECECREGMAPDYSGYCICPEGKTEDLDGKCVDKPCDGDPVPSPQIVSSGSSGRKGGTFGCTRSNINKTCGGVRGKKNHDGIDIKAEVDTPTFSMYQGKVHSIRNTFSAGKYKKNSYGNYIIIKSTVDSKTVYIRYNHLNKVSVEKDDEIYLGQIIGLNGNTGNAAARGVTSHIHIQILDSNWKSINPADYLKTKFDSEYKPISNNCN